MRAGPPEVRRRRDADYNRQYRSKGHGAAYARAQRRAYWAAMARLRELHREEFDDIYGEEKRRQGIA